MASGFKVTFANSILDDLLSAAPLYLAVFTVAPTNTTDGTEVSGGGYARQPVTLDPASGGTTATSALITFPVASADWGDLVAVALCDAVSAGTQLWWGNITDGNGDPTTLPILSGMTLSFPAGNITVTP
jgi:hypothetical protein